MELMETNLEAMLYGSSALEARIKERPAAPVEDTKAGVNDGVDGAPGHEPGRSLSDASDGGSQQRQHQLLLPLMKVLKIAVQIARALEYMAPTILHRDLKPANVLVNGADSPDPVVKLSDFGLSRLRAATVATLHPEAGTPAYLAPECYDMETGVVTHHADIYSLGVLCWAMLTGRRPWKDLSIPAVAYKVAVLGERPPLEQVGKQRCPPALRRLIRQMWEHDPLRRPAAAEVVLALDGLIRELFDKQQAIARPKLRRYASVGGGSGTRSSSSSSSGVADEEALARQLEELELDID
ncbi:hypothetical protein HYH02_012160 [Chlamydomonas schloesseri]|uniref:Protein kinase domain-containing protein n=1 Tax=Chlamydomonas schloesseri TaxID=2026947 RepID=A0A835SXF6_9CHLO|nr:hypothetical protein HYH02_012160 [Chlamydomonas schloesseri]|eukprot:KAG2434964.1 hypothetical protein HYH02_012160 [Chlamydomonas schloesseri]